MCVAMAPLALIGGAVQLAGGAMSAAGAAAEGRKARQIADANAVKLEKQGRYDARQIRKKASFVNGQTVVDASSNGLMLAGSAMDIMMDNAVQGAINAANAQRNANDNAKVQRLEGEAAQTRANNAALGHLMGGFSGFVKAVA